MGKRMPILRKVDDHSNRSAPSFRKALGVLLLLAISGPACQTPQQGWIEVRLYDLAGTKLLRCNLTASSRNQNQGSMRSQAPNGEVFQGEWIKLNSVKVSTRSPSTGTNTSSQATLPSLPVEANPSSGALSWAAGLGLDVDHIPDEYFSFMLSGNDGTIIEGIFLDNAIASSMIMNFSFKTDGLPTGGLIGAARDNKGHRYKLIG